MLTHGLRYEDSGPTLDIVVEIQKYFHRHGHNKTRVLPAALTTPEECMSLAGANHITIAPPLLRQLSETEYNDDFNISLFDKLEKRETHAKLSKQSYIDDEATYRLAVTRSENGRSEEKLTQALNVFCDAQAELVQMVQPLLGRDEMK